MSIFTAIIALVLGVIVVKIYASARRLKRAEFIRTYSFPQGLLARLSEKRPNLTLKEEQLVSRGLRQFFVCNLQAKGAFVSMPSKVVDDLWHEFILFTKQYSEFCKQAFGGFLHHTPAVVLGSQATANAGLRRVWWHACKDENINPRNPTRLPLLFALDNKLNIADGYSYTPDCSKIRNKNDNSVAINCATDFSDSSFAGGSDGFGDSSSSSDSSSGDSGGSSCGGGGCGGGSGD